MNFDKPQELNKENIIKKQIELIENSSLTKESKLELALLLLDKKQGVQIGDFKIINSEEERALITKEFTEELSNILRLLDAVELQYKIVKELSEENDIIGFSVLTSKDKAILDRFVQAGKENDDKTFGEIVGYPSTAVEAYGTDKALDIYKDLSPLEFENLQTEGILPFLLFTPSKEHWNDELKWARENQQLIKEKAPKLYEEVTQVNE